MVKLSHSKITSIFQVINTIRVLLDKMICNDLHGMDLNNDLIE